MKEIMRGEKRGASELREEHRIVIKEKKKHRELKRKEHIPPHASSVLESPLGVAAAEFEALPAADCRPQSDY